MRGHNVYFKRKIRKIIPKLPLLPLICSTAIGKSAWPISCDVRMANSADHDQTALGAVWYGSTLFAQTCPSIPEFQIRGGIEDNSKIISLISQRKHML